jgi:hypothetical protein
VIQIRMIVFVVLILCNLSEWTYAGLLTELYRGARSQGMGNTYVAIADDEQAIFMNPAGLAGNKRYVFNYAVLDTSISSDLLSTFQEGVSAFQNLSGDSLNVLIGKNVYGETQLTSSLLMPNFGIAIIVDGQTAIFAQNKALPQITLGYQTTNGVQAAYGMSLTRGGQQKSDLRIGFGAKMLWRRGGYTTLPLMTLMSLNKDRLSEITGDFARGYGVDAGAQYIYKYTNQLTLSSGLVYTDIGDTQFGASGADRLKANLAIGAAAQYEFSRLRAALAYDFRHILHETDWRKKSHIGIEFGLPLFSLYAGVNQVFLTYGAAIDVWFIKFTISTYAEEHGSFVYQSPERRWMMKLALRFKL